MISLLEGALAGSAHVLSGPDHLAAILPLAADSGAPKRAGGVGALWGLGHGLGIVSLGLLARLAVSAGGLKLAASYAEALVGIVLMILGGITLRRASDLSHGPHDHSRPHRHTRTAFSIGLLHGCAGGRHFWVVLPAMALAGEELFLYFAGYLLSTVLAMAFFANSLGVLAKRCGPKGLPRLLRIAGCVSLVTGVIWIIL